MVVHPIATPLIDHITLRYIMAWSGSINGGHHSMMWSINGVLIGWVVVYWQPIWGPFLKIKWILFVIKMRDKVWTLSNFIGLDQYNFGWCPITYTGLSKKFPKGQRATGVPPMDPHHEKNKNVWYTPLWSFWPLDYKYWRKVLIPQTAFKKTGLEVLGFRLHHRYITIKVTCHITLSEPTNTPIRGHCYSTFYECQSGFLYKEYYRLIVFTFFSRMLIFLNSLPNMVYICNSHTSGFFTYKPDPLYVQCSKIMIDLILMA